MMTMILAAALAWSPSARTAVRPPLSSPALTPTISSGRCRGPTCYLGEQQVVSLKESSAAPQPQQDTTLSLGHARALLAGVACVYGTNYAAVKMLDEWVGLPAAAAALRFALCVAVLAPCLASAAARFPRVVRWPMARDGLEVGAVV